MGALALASCCASPKPPEAKVPAGLLYAHAAPGSTDPVKPCPPLSEAESLKLAESPVIDIHTHTFTARYLPLMNIARARARLYPYCVFLNDVTVYVLVSGLLEFADRKQRGVAGEDSAFIEAKQEQADTAAGFGISVDDVRKGESRHGGEGLIDKAAEPSDKKIEEILTDRSKWRRFGEMLAAIEDDAQTDKMTAGERKTTVGRFLSRLVSSDAKLRGTLVEVYNRDPAHVDLFVHHTMQMGPTYGQKPGDNFMDFKAQLKRVRELDAAEGNAGKFLHFVAFNPFMLTLAERSEPADGWANSPAIKMVEKAIKKGAWGVKYYAPAGYRPSHNEIPKRPDDPLLAKQWDARYEGFTNKALDDLNRALFAYCAKNNVPILAHSQHGEFEALPGYGAAMSHPSYFRPILEEFKELRLCFGHAGGTQFWFSNGTAAEREGGEQVFELCTQYKNVYCEVGIFREITKEEPRARFIRNVSDLVHRNTTYSFGRKILYGTDWYMPNAIAVEGEFLARYQDVFSTGELSCHYRDFFSRNAVAFLDLHPENKHFKELPSAIQESLRPLLTRIEN